MCWYNPQRTGAYRGDGHAQQDPADPRDLYSLVRVWLAVRRNMEWDRRHRPHRRADHDRRHAREGAAREDHDSNEKGDKLFEIKVLDQHIILLPSRYTILF